MNTGDFVLASLGDVMLGFLMVIGVFLMFVILLQRGRGGGLAGAFGGLGGQSAFGTKAGDVFTVITIVTVVIWVVLACLTGARLNYEENSSFKGQKEQPAAEDPVKKSKPADDDGAEAISEGKADSGDTEPEAGDTPTNNRMKPKAGTGKRDAEPEKGDGDQVRLPPEEKTDVRPDADQREAQGLKPGDKKQGAKDE
jgi:preprotein translocase subunit SecG